ncbi:MAG: acylphosphatase [Polyangia bacterium]|jgi:acylphosphatase
MSDGTPAKPRRLRAVVLGSVQGVGFRATTLDQARRLGLAGWVRNRADGTVEVLAEGAEPKLNLFLAYLRRGPLGAHVAGVVEDWSDEQGAPIPFQVKRTE